MRGKRQRIWKSKQISYKAGFRNYVKSAHGVEKVFLYRNFVIKYVLGYGNKRDMHFKRRSLYTFRDKRKPLIKDK